ncbi:hypothetical protein RP20_CCG007364 [Aedes albopictus]|nr:hypothetical protein RP20_CCG007364 [Aedes albopictus]
MSIKISIEDQLSKAICAMCRQRLTEFHHFRERSQEVQGVLRSMLQNKDVSVENVMTGSKRNKDSNEHRCTLCGKSFLKSQHLDKHMKNHTNMIHDNKKKLLSEGNAALIEPKEIKIEPIEESDIEPETQRPSSTSTPETLTQRGSRQNSSAIRSREGEHHDGLFIGEIECEPAMIDMDDVKVESNTGGDVEFHIDVDVLPDKTSSEICANTSNGMLPINRKEVARNVESFQCNKCHKTVQSGRALWSHYRTVHGPKNHMCRICEIGFPFLKELKKHEVTNKHVMKLKEIEENQSSKVQKEPEDTSDVCEMTENNNKNPSSKPHRKLKRKRQAKEYMNNYSEVEEEQPIHRKHKEYMTEEADADYRPHISTTDQSLQSILSADGEQLLCDICHEVFPNDKKLMLHKKYHSSKSHECSICGKTFLNRFVLQEHISSHGSRKPKPKSAKPVVVPQRNVAGKPYECHICQKVFKLQSSLRNHRNEKHAQRTHGCQFCGRLFATGFDLQWHMKIHFNSDGEETEGMNEVKEMKFTP